MKKQFFAVLGIAVVFAACQNSSENNSEATGDTTAVAVNSLMGDGSAEAGDADSTDSTAHGRFIPTEEAQPMIDAYTGNPLPGVPTNYYLVSARKMKKYIEYAEAHNIKDIQLILARNNDHGDNGLTLVITGVDANGHHILYPDPTNGNKPSALEHVFPCPPGTDCIATTNLSH